MITLTPAAAEQIKESARQGHMEGMPLRLAVTRQSDGSFHYAMGFDDVPGDEDSHLYSEGIEIVVAPSSRPLLEGTAIDYVELEPGQYRFIFLNPNDPSFSPPSEG
jgi:iron-sulfur cluster assembly protein